MCSQLFTLLLLVLSLTLATCLEPEQTTTSIASTAPSEEIDGYPKNAELAGSLNIIWKHLNDLVDDKNKSAAESKNLSKGLKEVLQRVGDLETRLTSLDEVAKNASIASQQEKTIYIPITYSKKNWSEAFADCRAWGMNLASIESEVEYQKVMKKVTSIGIRPDGVDFWISGKRHGDEGRFQWMSNGHTVTYNQWRPGQPDLDKGCPRGDLDLCIEINQKFNNQWNDFCCSHPQYYICQIKI